MVVGATLDNPLPNGDFKTCSDARCLFCKHNINTNSFRSPIWVELTKYWTTRLATKTTFARFVLSNLLGKQVTSAKVSTTTSRPQIPRNSTKLFNVRCHKLEDSGVINHNPHWTDAERKSQKNFRIHRLKSFRLNPINKQIDIIKMNVS